MDNFLKKLIVKENLSHNEMTDLMQSIMSGGLSPNLVSAILTALSIKGETIDEISAAAQVLRDNLTPVDLDDDVVDTCGTGGDGLKTFNISTCASFVAAGGECDGSRVVPSSPAAMINSPIARYVAAHRGKSMIPAPPVILPFGFLVPPFQ